MAVDRAKVTTLIHEPHFLWFDGITVTRRASEIENLTKVWRAYTPIEIEDIFNKDLFPSWDRVEGFFKKVGDVVELTVCPSCRSYYDAEVEHHECWEDEEGDSGRDPDYDL